MGRGQLGTKCPFLETEAFGGLFRCAGSNSGAGDRKPKSMEKTPPHRAPTVSLGRRVGVAVYNDFINYVCTIVIIGKWPPT